MQDGIAVIAKGLSPGEKVVVDGQYRLTDGARVRLPRQAGRRRMNPPPPPAGRPAHVHEGDRMSISEPFIRRPIATSLLMLGVLVFGIGAYNLLPVAAVPNVDFPTITVTAQFPGANPSTMASAVATPLETAVHRRSRR